MKTSVADDGLEICAFVGIAEGLALVAGKLDAVVPLAELGDAAAGELDDDVHRLAVHDIAGQEGADAVGVLNAARAVFVNLDGTVDVQAVGIHHLLGGRVDAEGLVLGDDLLGLLLLVAAVHAESLVHHGHALGEVGEEHLVAEAVVQVDTVIAVVDVAELPHDVEVQRSG